jgi:hypothetical protein
MRVVQVRIWVLWRIPETLRTPADANCFNFDYVSPDANGLKRYADWYHISYPDYLYEYMVEVIAQAAHSRNNGVATSGNISP